MKTITEKQIESYRTYLINEEKSAATIEKYIRDITSFAAWMGDAELEKSCVLAYKEELIVSYAPSSVNAAIASLNSFFRFCAAYIKRDGKILFLFEKGYTRNVCL